MTKPRHPFLSACWLALALMLSPMLCAQEAPPPPVVPEEPAAAAAVEPVAPEVEKTDETAAAADDKTVAPADQKEGGELRELGTDEEETGHATKKKSIRSRSGGNRRHEGPPPFGDHTVSVGSTQREAVSIFGSTVVDGHVTGEAVSVFGDTTVNGTVGGEAVSVFGSTTIKGKVKGETVTVFGDLVLGPEAEVGGEAVVIFGKIIRSPGAQIHGNIQEIGKIGPFGDFTGLRVWFTKCLLMGRPLAFDSRLLWAWHVAFGILAFYVLIALIASSGVRKCVDTFEQQPGYSLLSALLTLLLTPVAYLLLVLTLVIVIGFVLIPVFSLGLFFAAVFGKIVMLAWLGRCFTRLMGDGPLAHPAFGVLLGGLIVIALYAIPIGGFIVYNLLGILGLGVVIYTLILQFKASRPPKPAVSAPIGPVSPAVTGLASLAGGVAREVPPMVSPALPVISAVTLPRAGFWIRVAAVLVDVILVGMLCGFLGNMWHGFGSAFPFWFALYHVIMWATKATTIGGIICSLKVVRLDDRPVNWSVAIVRALGAFLSLVVVGLGFIWVAFDEERQSWHDKIAGTTIVRVPKGTPLV